MLKIYYSVYIMLQYFYLFGNEIAYIIYLTYVCIIVHSLYRTIILESMHQSLLFLFLLVTAKFCCIKDIDNKKQYCKAHLLSFIFLDDAPPIYYFRHYFSVFVIRSSISWCFCVCIFFIVIFVFLLLRPPSQL